MTDVFRAGRKSVHRAIVSGDPDDPMRPAGCNLDLLPGSWGPEQPEGPRCAVCFSGFAGVADPARPRNSRPRTPALALASGALAIAFLGGVWASPDQRPMISYTASTVPSTTPSWAAPSATAGIPEQTPAFSMGPESASPAVSPVGTLTPVPPVVIRVIERRVVIVEPGPRPTPAPTACPHPGVHLGLKPCRWPHA